MSESTSRFLSRQRIVQALYQWEISQDSIQSISAQFTTDFDRMNGADKVFFTQRLHAIHRLIENIDEKINGKLARTKYHLSEIDYATLRLATYELLYTTDVPKNVAIDQAIEVTRVFGSLENTGFINAMLESIIQTHDHP